MTLKLDVCLTSLVSGREVDQDLIRAENMSDSAASFTIAELIRDVIEGQYQGVTFTVWREPGATPSEPLPANVIDLTSRRRIKA